MKNFRVEVTHYVDVSIDEKKFTEKFLKEFREHFYNFQTVEDHVAHLAWMEVQDMLPGDFIEGYGSKKEMGIDIHIVDSDSEVQ